MGDMVLMLFDEVTTSLVTIALAFAAAAIFPLRHPRAFWALMWTSVIVSKVSTIMDWPAGVRMACWILNYIVIPYACWEGPRAWRLLFAVALLLTEMLCEVAFALIYTLLGVPLDDARGGVPFILTSLVRFAVCAILIVAGGLLQKRAQKITGRLPDTPAGWFVLFFAVQPVMMGCLLAQATYTTAVLDGWALAGMAVSGAGIVVALAVSARLMMRYGAAEQAAEQARQLEDMHARCLAEGRETLDALEDAARFRHDQRNHLQVLDGLVERGERAQAQAYVRDLRARLGEGE